MKEEKRKISFREDFTISKFRFWIGLFFSVLLSFSIYIFSVSLRDYLRLLTFTQNFNYLEFTKNELLFYNLFYAFLALLIGQTFFFKIVFDTNKKTLERRIQFNRKKIVHNQNVLIWIFLYWFFKLSIMYGMFNMNSFGVLTNYSFSIYQHIDFYKEYNYLFILIILVLYIQSWQSLRYFTKNYYKNIFITFGLISTIAIVFSQINILPFESNFSEIKKNNLYTKLQIDLPKSGYTQSFNSYFFQNQYFVSSDSRIYSNQDKKPLSLNELISEIKKFETNNYRGIEKYIQLNIDKNTPIKFVYKVKKAILLLTDYKIAYSNYPIILENSISLYQDNPIGVFEGRSYLKKGELLESYISKYENRIELKQNHKNEVLIDGKSFKRNVLIEYIKDKKLEEENYVISIELKENAVFNDYVQLLSIATEACYKAFEIKLKSEEHEDYYNYFERGSVKNFHIIDVNAPSYERITNSVEILDYLNNEK